MKLTVIMPVFNGAQTVSRAVASVGRLSSLMDGELRMIAVDDCSTDDTHPILMTLKARHPFLEVLRLPRNGGPGPARNHALDQVSEGWIGFIDADDEIIAEPYADVLRRGEHLNRDFITFNGYFISEDTVARKYDFERIADDRRLMAKTSLRSELDGSVIFSIYHSKLVQAHDLRFGRDFYEDIVFSNLGLILAERRLILNAYCYKKHWSGISIVNTVSERHIKGLLGAIVDLRNRLLEKGLYGADLSDDFAYGAHGLST
ncbi:hypothetical protein GCM10011316_17140 [Roseibium aquae]|uniref:Glycosyltransferase 2-like domain-containing protein n=1 Tax=Roseibium aquae TaxID=1323746 RepID=A0A916TIA6_9HYPH|nr:glycosyltransferase family 2 protein [Roseibium aquae]GGB45648.1 hypothetical protein GCM10011316_17140 [Roseibium aquae]